MRFFLKIIRYVSNRSRLKLAKLMSSLDKLIVSLCYPLLSHIFSTIKQENIKTDVILVCMYRHTKKRKNDSVEAQTLLASLMLSKWKNQISCYYQDNRYLSSLLWLYKVFNEKPTKILLSSYNQKSPHNPCANALRLAKLTGAELIFMWWDTCSNTFYHENVEIMGLALKNVVVDNPKKYFFPDNNITGKILFTHAPVVAMRDLPQFSSRVGGLFFSGSTQDYRSIRTQYLERLANSVVKNNLHSANNPNFSYEDYRDNLRTYLASISFPESVACDQLKARVFEILCSGGLLIERENEQTKCFFTKGKDYVTFTDETDLIEKIVDILQRKEDYAVIAESGYKKAVGLCDPDKYWSQILS